MRFLLLFGHQDPQVNVDYLRKMHKTELVLTYKIRNDKLC